MFKALLASLLLVTATALANPMLTQGFWRTVTPADLLALVRGGAEVNARDWRGLTVMHFAAAGAANPEIIRTLVELGAAVNARTQGGSTPLHLAAFSNTNPEIIRSLVALGAEVNARTQDGETPLHLAARYSESSEVVLVLLELGADHRARDIAGLSAWDWIEGNMRLKNTPAYKQLSDLRF